VKTGVGRALPDRGSAPSEGEPLDRLAVRPALSFRLVNCANRPGYEPGLQRHHILPRQLLNEPAFGPLVRAIEPRRLGFDDFRRNGLLLPAQDAVAVRVGLPLHRGPHRTYNQLVFERVGQIESTWSTVRLRAPEIALQDALERLSLLQRALRRRLLSEQRRSKLNRNCPLGTGVDFTEIDAMAGMLWPMTEPTLP
jgi:A nuclease family of the HNH/ENDO VII superfamily with conserved AHH